jgi:integrase
LREITYFDVQAYQDERLKTPTIYKRQRTISAWNREACVLRRVFSIAVQQGWLFKNPFSCGDPLILISAECRRERILTKQEEILMLKACETHPYRKHLQPLLIFLLDTGCRKSEALKLRWQSVDLDSRIITIEGMTTKTLKTRQVMMTVRIFLELEKLRQLPTYNSDETVFQIKDNVRKSFASICKIAGVKHGGIDGITLHSLRHTAASRLVQKGMNPQMAGRLLGHSQPQTTYRYLSADLVTMQQAASILENL